MLTRIFAVLRKEFIQIVRDPRTLAVMFFIPIVQLFVLGYAATNDVDHIPTAVLDWDNTRESRTLVDAYRASGYFDIRYYADNEAELQRLVDGGQARSGLVIPRGFGSDLARDHRAQVAVIIDGSDPTIANTALSAASAVGQAQGARVAASLSGLTSQTMPGVDVRPRVWYNPQLASANFMVPGIIGVVMQLLTILLTSMAIVRERERGTLEQLIVTPLKSGELIVGKLVPYVFIAFLDTMLILALGVWWFRVPIAGSLPLLMGLSALGLMTSLSLGLLISTVSKTQQEAMLLSFFVIIPSIFLSGFVFARDAMPLALRLIGYAIPMTYFLVIVRGIMIKGIGLDLLRTEVLAMTAFGVFILTVAAMRFRKRLE
ncbi:MAG: ABC transporter permease [Anaerolineae bacterium]